MSCSKWFRYPFLRRLLLYETLSETEFVSGMGSFKFQQNVFINISCFLENKIQIMKIYDDEMGAFPFPRSEKAIRSLSAIRGSMVGCEAAESFVLIKESI